jgi:hypothetical protein
MKKDKNQPQKNAKNGEHPYVVGKADCEGKPEQATSINFAGREYHASGNAGKSIHDDTPVREFEHESGHKVWLDDAARVHANDQDEIEALREEAGKQADTKQEKTEGKRSNKPLAKALFFKSA